MPDEQEINQNSAQPPATTSTTTPAPQSASTTDYSAHEARIAKLEQEAKDTQTKLIESLGVFTALFTFISISIQIFHNIQYLDVAVALIIFLFVSLAGFVYLLDAVIYRNRFSFTILIVITTLLIATAFILTSAPFKIRLFEENKAPSTNQTQ